MQLSLAVAKVVLVADGKILLLKRSESAPRRPLTWDLPGGFVDEGEALSEAAYRELSEETGIGLPVDTFHLVYAESAVTDKGNTTWLFYLATAPKQEVVLSHEHVAYEWVMLEHAIANIPHDKQQNALTYLRDNHLLA